MNDTLHTENGAVEVAARLGISYRQLDHWCRTGMVELENDVVGSGHRRVLTEPEIKALADVVERLRLIEAMENELRSGLYFQWRRDEHVKMMSKI